MINDLDDEESEKGEVQDGDALVEHDCFADNIRNHISHLHDVHQTAQLHYVIVGICLCPLEFFIFLFLGVYGQNCLAFVRLSCFLESFVLFASH